MRVIPNPKMAFIFPISCILALIFPILIKYFPKCEGKGSSLYSQINHWCQIYTSGLEKGTRPLVFTSDSGCRASENFDISSEN